MKTKASIAGSPWDQIARAEKRLDLVNEIHQITIDSLTDNMLALDARISALEKPAPKPRKTKKQGNKPENGGNES